MVSNFCKGHLAWRSQIQCRHQREQKTGPMNGVGWSKLEMHPSLKQCAAPESLTLEVTLPLKSHDDKSSCLKSH